MLGEILALKRDDLAVFREVYDQYHPKLFHYIYQRTQSEFLSQEVVQITFIKLWERRSTLSDDYSIDIQLFRITKTVLIDQLRKLQVRQKHNGISAGYIYQSYDHFRPDDRDALNHVFAAMEKLPPLRKRAFKLSRMNGLSYKEIANIMSISPKTVENHISRAIKQLRRSISIFVLVATITGQFLFC